MLFIVKDIWPFVREKLFPAYIEEKKRKDEQSREERDRLKNLEDRQISAFEKVANAVTGIERVLAINTERLRDLQGGVNTLLDRQTTKKAG